ncbi:PseG/SpsG family protein [Rubritalea marina]|uniref:PseG/SpsG family protein n=1 Tax=Rubritalea marina TaxID=361055 RepID=UPI00037930D3|nr:hypothetical protein [Rubritalea marina]
MGKQGSHRVVFFTELGARIGYGHVMRCQTLAKCLVELGVSVRFCLFSYDWREDLYDTGYEQSYHSWHENELLFSELVKEDTIVVVDSYLANLDSYKSLKLAAQRVVVIDDYDRIEYPVDCVINPNIYYQRNDYRYSGVSFAGGPRYCLLRDEFHFERNEIRVRESIHEVLITVGGSDVRELIPRLLGKVVAVYPEINFHCVCGTSAYQLDLESLASAYSNLRLYGRASAVEMRNLMQKADLAITACGQTLGELSYMGVPMIGICVDVDQEKFRDYYVSNGLFLSRIDWDDVDWLEKIKEDLNKLSSYNLRNRMTHNLHGLIDSQGAIRAARVILG